MKLETWNYMRQLNSYHWYDHPAYQDLHSTPVNFSLYDIKRNFRNIKILLVRDFSYSSQDYQQITRFLCAR